MDASLLYKTQTRWLFHAHIKLKFSAFWDDSLFDELYAILEETDTTYNSYSDTSYISEINRNAGYFVTTDSITTQLLSQVKSLSDDLDGEYDITIMPLLRLWGFYKQEGWTVPAQQAMTLAKASIDYHRIEINNQEIKIDQDQEIITGSFIKAFAVDRAAARMRSTGITDAIINAGGSTICAINNELHPFWQVDVNDTEQKDNILFRLRIANQCYSTSANDSTYLEIDGKRYGHIISPKTGFPSANRQVGIISQDALTGDVFSTGLFNYNKNDFKNKMALLSRKYGVEGFLIDSGGELVFSENFEQYII